MIRTRVSCVLALVAVLAAPAPAAAATTRTKSRAASAARRAPKPAPAVAAAPAAVPTANESWKRARALADDRHYPEALAIVRDALQRHPDDVDLLWLQAGIFGWAGRASESVLHYQHLLARHPELARDLRMDLATQRLWAGDAAGAVRDFDLRLEENPSDRDAKRLRALALAHAGRHAQSLAAYDELLGATPDDLDLALGRARVVGWMGKNADAAHAYRAILARAPRNAEARMGLAQNENWSGRHRAAAALFEDISQDPQADPEALKGLAFAHYWAGRPDAARAALDRYAVKRPNDREGIQLANLLAREQSPSLTTGFARSDDTDDLRVATTTAAYRMPTRAGSAVELRFRRDAVKDPVGDRDPRRFGVAFEQRWSERWSAQAAAAHFDPGRGGEGLGLVEAGLTHRPNDVVRLDAGVAKEPVLTRMALENGILATTVTAGFDWRMTERWMLSGAQRWHAFNDDNAARRSSAAVRWDAAASRRGRVALTFGAEVLRTDENLDHGYYDPERYTEWGPGIDIEWTPTTRWTAGFVGHLGQQHEQGSEQQPFHNFTVTLQVPLARVVRLDLEGARSNSNLTAASGFEQERWSASLTTGF